MGDTKSNAGAGAELLAERATECRQHRQILFQGGCEVRTNPETGRTYLAAPCRYPQPEFSLRYPVAGLKATGGSSSIRFEFLSADCIDESDCVDAQCRAGWDDRVYGFGELEIGILPDGTHRARWSCSRSRE